MSHIKAACPHCSTVNAGIEVDLQYADDHDGYIVPVECVSCKRWHVVKAQVQINCKVFKLVEG